MLTPNSWIIIYLAVLVLFTYMGARQEGRFDPFSAQMLFNIPAALYSLGAVINYQWLGIDIGPYIGILIWLFEDALWMTVLGMVAFNCAYLFVPWYSIRYTINRILPPLNTTRIHEKVLAHWGLAIAFGGEVLFMIVIYYLGFDHILHNPYDTVVQIDKSSLSFFIHGSILLSDIGLVLATAYLFKTGRWKTPFGLITGILLLWHVGFWVFFGKRGALLIILLGVLISRHLLKKPVSIAFGAVFVFAMVFLFIVLELGRSSPTRMYSDQIEMMLFRAESLEDWRMWVGKVLSQGGLLGSLSVITELFPDVHEYRLGATYLEALIRIIPRFLWVDFFPQGYSLLVGENWAMFYLAEAYMNFGWIGIVIVPGLIGIGLRLFNEWKRTYRSHYMVVVIFAALAGHIVYLPRLDSGSLSKGFVYPLLVLFVLYITTLKFSRKKRIRNLKQIDKVHRYMLVDGSVRGV